MEAEAAVVIGRKKRKPAKPSKPSKQPRSVTRRQKEASGESRATRQPGKKKRRAAAEAADPDPGDGPALPEKLFPPTAEGSGWDWKKVEVENPLMWGCTEGGFLELEEVDAAEYEMDVATESGKIVSMHKSQVVTVGGDGATSQADEEEATPPAKKAKQAGKAAAKTGKSAAKEARLDAKHEAKQKAIEKAAEGKTLYLPCAFRLPSWL